MLKLPEPRPSLMEFGISRKLGQTWISNGSKAGGSNKGQLEGKNNNLINRKVRFGQWYKPELFLMNYPNLKQVWTNGTNVNQRKTGSHWSCSGNIESPSKTTWWSWPLPRIEGKRFLSWCTGWGECVPFLYTRCIKNMTKPKSFLSTLRGSRLKLNAQHFWCVVWLQFEMAHVSRSPN